MHILVDADSCPGVIKEILYRAAERTTTLMTLVADRPLIIPESSHIKRVQVKSGLNAADARIIELAQPGVAAAQYDIHHTQIQHESVKDQSVHHLHIIP